MIPALPLSVIKYVCGNPLLNCGGFFCVYGKDISVIQYNASGVHAFNMAEVYDDTTVYYAKVFVLRQGFTQSGEGTAAFCGFGTVDDTVV